MPPPETGSPKTQDSIHGYLLAGGQGSRMGRDKAVLSLGGLTLLDRALQTLAAVTADMTIVGRHHPDLRYLLDVAPHIGPVGGVTAALRDLQQRRAHWAFFLPVDVPLLPSGLLRALLGLWRSTPHTRVAFPLVQERPQPVISLIHVTALPAFEQAIKTGQHRLRAVLEAAAPPPFAPTQLTITPDRIFADAQSLAWRPNPAELAIQHLWFANCNTPDVLASLEAVLARSEQPPVGAPSSPY